MASIQVLKARAAAHLAIAAEFTAEAEVKAAFPVGCRVVVYGDRWRGTVKHYCVPDFDYVGIAPDDPNNDECKYLVSKNNGLAMVKIDCIDLEQPT